MSYFTFRVTTIFYLIIILSSAICVNAENEKLTLTYFGSSTCGECNEIRVQLLKPLLNTFDSTLSISFYDTEDELGFKLMMSMEESYGVTMPQPQELFFPDTVLLGYESIMMYAKPMIQSYLNDKSRWSKNRGKINTTVDSGIKKRLEKFTFISILFAGIIDGINPCAIATMIFLISFLATKKRKKSEILTIGISFTIAVFTTYMLLGIGAFKALTALEGYHWISESIRWIAVAVAAILGIVSFSDAFSFKKSGDVKKIKLQLPKMVKTRIHKVISENLSGKQLLTGAIITGFLVTLLEAVCTGQVYLPTIVLMTKSVTYKMQGWFYLTIYNLLFVLPLVIVMILAYFGMKWNELAKKTQENITAIKILLGIILLSLALFLGIAG